MLLSHDVLSFKIFQQIRLKYILRYFHFIELSNVFAKIKAVCTKPVCFLLRPREGAMRLSSDFSATGQPVRHGLKTSIHIIKRLTAHVIPV